MAKFHITYKSPDTPYECMEAAKKNIPAGDVARVCDKFNIGEYLILELDTEAMTCVIVPERGHVLDDEYYQQLTDEWAEERTEEQAEIDKWDKLVEEPDAVAVAQIYSKDRPTLASNEWKTTSSETGLFKGETIQRIPIKKVRDL